MQENKYWLWLVGDLHKALALFQMKDMCMLVLQNSLDLEIFQDCNELYKLSKVFSNHKICY